MRLPASILVHPLSRAQVRVSSLHARSRGAILDRRRFIRVRAIPDIIAIGGGITGAARTDAVAREGHAVTLIEQRGIAAMASGWTLGGVRQSGRDPSELPLARAAVALWAGLRDTLGADVEY